MATVHEVLPAKTTKKIICREEFEKKARLAPPNPVYETSTRHIGRKVQDKRVFVEERCRAVIGTVESATKSGMFVQLFIFPIIRLK